jgi:hypothetical protein
MAPPAPRECNQPARSALHRKQSAHRAAQRSAAHCIATSSQHIGPRIASRASQRIASHPVHRLAPRECNQPARSACNAAHCIANNPRCNAAHCIANNPRTDNQPATPGQVVTAKRNSLHPSTVTLLVFLHEAIPGVIERKARAIIQDKILVE